MGRCKHLVLGMAAEVLEWWMEVLEVIHLWHTSLGGSG